MLNELPNYQLKYNKFLFQYSTFIFAIFINLLLFNAKLYRILLANVVLMVYSVIHGNNIYRLGRVENTEFNFKLFLLLTRMED